MYTWLYSIEIISNNIWQKYTKNLYYILNLLAIRLTCNYLITVGMRKLLAACLSLPCRAYL